MPVDVDVSTEIDQIKDMLRTNTEDKLELIRFFLINSINIEEIRIANADGLITFLQYPDTPYEVIEDVYELLDQTFSRGYPNFIFQFELKSDVEKNDLVKNLRVAVPEDDYIQPHKDTHTYLKRIGSIQCDHNKVVIKVQFEKYKDENRLREGPKKGALELKSTFDIEFDFSIMLCYVKCGDRRQLNAVEKTIQTHITRCFEKFNGFYFRSKLEHTEVQNQFDLDKQTIVLLDFLENELIKNNYSITNYFTIAFSNSQSDKVKSVRLGGSNLLESIEVADRIRQGDKIKSVRFQLYQELNSKNAHICIVKIDFEQHLKITFSRLKTTRHIRENIHHIYNSLLSSLDKIHEEEVIKRRLNDMLRKIRVQESMFLHSIISQIKQDIEELSLNDKEKVTQVLDKYTLEGDN